MNLLYLAAAIMLSIAGLFAILVAFSLWRFYALYSLQEAIQSRLRSDEASTIQKRRHKLILLQLTFYLFTMCVERPCMTLYWIFGVIKKHEIVYILYGFAMFGVIYMFFLRTWILNYDLSYNYACSELGWRTLFDPTQQSWWMKHRNTFGKPEWFLKRVVFPMWFISWIITIIVRLTIWDVYEISQLTDSVFMFIPVMLTSILFCIVPGEHDYWGIKSELGQSCGVGLICLIGYVVVFMFVQTDDNKQWCELSYSLLIYIPVIFSALRSTLIVLIGNGQQFGWSWFCSLRLYPTGWRNIGSIGGSTRIMNSYSATSQRSKSKSKKKLKTIGNYKESQKQISKIHLDTTLQNKAVFKHFVHHLVHEFAIENLIFVCETAQLYNRMARKLRIKKPKIKFELNSEIPENTSIHSMKVSQHASLWYWKFIHSSAPMEINIKSKTKIKTIQFFEDFFAGKRNYDDNNSNNLDCQNRSSATFGQHVRRISHIIGKSLTIGKTNSNNINLATIQTNLENGIKDDDLNDTSTVNKSPMKLSLKDNSSDIDTIQETKMSIKINTETTIKEESTEHSNAWSKIESNTVEPSYPITPVENQRTNIQIQQPIIEHENENDHFENENESKIEEKSNNNNNNTIEVIGTLDKPDLNPSIISISSTTGTELVNASPHISTTRHTYSSIRSQSSSIRRLNISTQPSSARSTPPPPQPLLIQQPSQQTQHLASTTASENDGITDEEISATPSTTNKNSKTPKRLTFRSLKGRTGSKSRDVSETESEFQSHSEEPSEVSGTTSIAFSSINTPFPISDVPKFQKRDLQELKGILEKTFQEIHELLNFCHNRFKNTNIFLELLDSYDNKANSGILTKFQAKIFDPQPQTPKTRKKKDQPKFNDDEDSENGGDSDDDDNNDDNDNDTNESKVKVTLLRSVLGDSKHNETNTPVSENRIP